MNHAGEDSRDIYRLLFLRNAGYICIRTKSCNRVSTNQRKNTRSAVENAQWLYASARRKTGSKTQEAAQQAEKGLPLTLNLSKSLIRNVLWHPPLFCAAHAGQTVVVAKLHAETAQACFRYSYLRTDFCQAVGARQFSFSPDLAIVQTDFESIVDR